MIEVRPIRSGEWEKLRYIRLEALTDSPDAFFTTRAEAETYPDSVWKDRAAMGALGGSQMTAIAIDGIVAVGMATGLLRADITPDVVPIVSVFVASSARRKGVGAAMLSVIEEWASGRGASQTSLWVVDSNDRARGFYESIGYRATTDRQKVPVPPDRYETRHVKTLIVAG
jgi:GNAT superfamily N-acetyltransferase